MPTREEIRAMAHSIVQVYSATLRIDDKASVHKGTKPSVGLPDRNGWWVDCQVFVPDEDN